jgi:hypothetical protein
MSHPSFARPLNPSSSDVPARYLLDTSTLSNLRDAEDVVLVEQAGQGLQSARGGPP